LAGQRQPGEALAGKSTLNRMELTPADSLVAKRYHKITYSPQALDALLAEARGEMENRIKEQLSLFSDRLSTQTLRTNQLRLYFSSFAYVLVHALRRLALAGTEWATAQVNTIRLRLLKIAAEVRLTARRIWVRYSHAYP
jgi:hypothetical protein